MKNIKSKSQGIININIETILLILLAFIVLSAGTKWGYMYRKFAIYGVGITTFVMIIMNRGNFKIHINHIIFFVYLFITCRFSIAPGVSFRWILNIVLFATIFMWNFESDFWKRFIKITYVVSIVVAVSVIISAIQPVLFAKVFGRILGDMDVFLLRASHGQYAGLAREIAEAAVICNYGIAVCIADLMTEKKMDWKKAVSLLVLFLGLILTTKRTLFLVPILIFILLILLTEKNLNNKLKWILIFAVAALLLAILMFSVPQLHKVLERFMDTENYEDMGGREVLWALSINMFASNHYFGVGYNTYNVLAEKIGIQAYNGHNIYLQLLGEGGIVGFVFIIGYFLFNLILTLYLLNHNKGNRKVLVFSVYIQLMFFIYGFTGNVLNYIQQLTMWLLACNMVNTEKKSGGIDDV